MGADGVLWCRTTEKLMVIVKVEEDKGIIPTNSGH